MTNHSSRRRPWRPHPDDVFIGTCIALSALVYAGAFTLLLELMRAGVI